MAVVARVHVRVFMHVLCSVLNRLRFTRVKKRLDRKVFPSSSFYGSAAVSCMVLACLLLIVD